MHPVLRLRQMIDKLNKQAAAHPPMPSGGDARMTSEAVNTGANARGLAAMRYPKAKLARKI